MHKMLAAILLTKAHTIVETQNQKPFEIVSDNWAEYGVAMKMTFVRIIFVYKIAREIGLAFFTP